MIVQDARDFDIVLGNGNLAVVKDFGEAEDPGLPWDLVRLAAE